MAGKRRLGFESLEDRRLLHGVASVTPINGEANVSDDINIVAQFDFDADPATVNSSSFELRDPQGTLVPASVTYDAPGRTATLIPISDLADVADYYQARVVGGASGVQELGGAAMETDFVWHFITETPLYSDIELISGLNTPTAVEFAADGRVFVAEKSGLIKIFDTLTDPTPDLFADLRTNVHNHWDRGLLGMTLHPNFPNTPELYVLYTYDAPLRDTSLPPGSQDLPPAPYWGSPGSSGDPGPGSTGDGPSASGRLSRLTVGSDNSWDNIEHVLVHDWGQQFPSHTVGDLVFGDDGALYASAGDAASFSTEDYGQDDFRLGSTVLDDPPNQGGALRSQDLRSRNLGTPIPDDPVSLDGSLIRIDASIANGGAPLSDNPLFGDADPNAARIVAHGLRNPFRIAARPGTDEIWIGDVGYRDWEEINVIRNPTNAIDNFGWPAYEGPNKQPGYDGLDLPLLENLYGDPLAHVEPYYSYDHSQPVFPGGPTPAGGSSISGLAFSEGGNLPPAYDGALFVSDFSRTSIWVMFPGVDGDPNADSGTPVQLNAQNPVQLKIGPDGDLYYVDVAGSIRRIRFEGVDVPPVAAAQANPASGPLNPTLLVNFDGTASSDQNPGDTLTYKWDLDGDGNFNDSTSSTPSYVYTTPGVVTVTLEVTDSTGLTDTDTVDISVGNTVPTAVIDTPTSSFTWKVGDTINFSGHADDVDEAGGVLPPSALEWTINLLHCPGGLCHTHTVTTVDGVASGTFIAPDHEYPSQLEIILAATDPVTGLRDTDTILLSPQTVDFTLLSNPPGLDLTINGAADTTPFNFTVIAGSNNLVSAPSPQTAGQINYEFASWSDGGAQNHNITAGNQPITLTANFNSVITPFDTTDDGLGTITAQGEIGSFQGKEKAFDNLLTKKWLDLANQDPSTRASWIQYQYANDEKYIVTSYTITSGNDAPARDPRDWTLSGSNDGVNYFPIDSRSDEFFSARTETRTFTTVNSTGYNIYRLDIHSVADPPSASSIQIGEIELIGVPDSGGGGTPTVALTATDPSAGEGTPADPGVFTFVRSGDLSGAININYAISGNASNGDYAETLSGTITIADQNASAIITITPVEDPDTEGNETLVLTLQSGAGYQIGTLNSDTVIIVDNDGITPFDTTDDGLGTITAQGEIGSFQGKEKAFDNLPDKKWLDFADQDPSTRASWIQYQYANDEKYVISSYTITSGNDAPARDPRDWTLSGSNDGVNYFPIDSRSGEFFSARTETRTFNVVNSTAYNIYRLDIHSVADPPSASSIQIGEIELIGVPDTGGGNNPPIAVDDFFDVAESATLDANVLATNPATWNWTVPVISEDQVNNSTASPPSDGSTDSTATGSATVQIRRNPEFILGNTTNLEEEYLISLTLNWNGLIGDLTKVHIHGWLTPQGQPVGQDSSTPTHLYEIPGLESESAVIASGVNRTSDSYSVTDLFLPHTHPFDDPTALISPRQIVDEFAAGRVYFNIHSTVHPMGEIRGNLPDLSLSDRDPDGDAIVVNQVNGNPGFVGVQTTLASGALLLMNPDGTFNYDTNGQFDNLTSGTSAIDTFQYTIDDSNNGTATATATVTVIGEGAVVTPTVTLAATDPSAAEDTPADPGVFTFTRDGDLTGALNVNYAISGNAANGDYVETLSGTVTIPDQSATATITITPVDDPDFEGDETLTFTLQSGAGYQVGAPNSDTVTITDNDLPPLTVTLTATDPSAAEDTPADPGVFTFTRDGDPTGALNVNYAISGNAANGDYVETLSGTVTIPDQSATATITITPVDDPDFEGDETLVLTLQSGAAYVIGTPNSDTVIIVDNDGITPFDTTDDGLGTITAQGEIGSFQGKEKAFDNLLTKKWLDLANQDPSTRASWIQYQYANDEKYIVTSYTITSGNDAPARDPRDWTLSGSNDGVNYFPIDSRSDEFFSARTETRTFTTVNSTGYNIYRLDIHSVADPPSASSIQIGEIELIGVPDSGGGGTPTVALTATDPSAGEGTPADPGVFTFVRSGDLSGAININYAISGNASNGDYAETLSGTITIADQNASAIITITPVEDPDTEGNETLVLTLQSGAGYQIGTLNSDTVIIVDNDGITPFDTTDDGLGTITAQGEIGSFQGKEKAFDNLPDKKWLDFADQDPSTRASWIQYQYANDEKYVISSYTITSGNDAPARDPRDWTLSGSNDGVNYFPIDSRSGEFFSARTETRTFNVVNSTAYNIYRLDIHSVADPPSASSIQIGEIELIGVPENASAEALVGAALNLTFNSESKFGGEGEELPTYSSLDVNGDNQVTALDALLVVNQLARQGNVISLQVRPSNFSQSGTWSDFDVNKDGIVSANDALVIINSLRLN